MTESFKLLRVDSNLKVSDPGSGTGAPMAERMPARAHACTGLCGGICSFTHAGRAVWRAHRIAVSCDLENHVQI